MSKSEITTNDKPPIRIASMRFICDPVPGGLGNLAAFGEVRTINPHPRLSRWTVSIRGSALFLISPPGWAHNITEREYDKDGPRKIYEIPRHQCLIMWESADPAAVEKLTRHDQLLDPSSAAVSS
jgi:hypothetical protein